MAVIELVITPGQATGSFRVDVVRSPAGEASAVAVLDVEALLARREQLERAVLASAVSSRRVLPQTERPIREIGQVLFSALLGSGDVAGRYRATAALAAERGEGLRVVLRVDTPALAGLPWEAMYDAVTGGYVCRRDQLVRHVPVAAVVPPLTVQPPLRILGIVSSPRGLPPLDVEKEQEQLTRALARLDGQGLIEVHWAAEATWAELQDLLLGGQWHVVHFIGHGDFDIGQDEGVLALTRDDGRADLVEADRLVDLLREARPMPRLVVLNSCSGAMTGARDLFASTAAALVRGGVSAVAAMQYSISDPAAVAFARGFYTAIAHGRGVDEATSSGRVAILGTGARTLEWVTPVMYLRGRENRLFILHPPSPSDSVATPKPATPSSDRAGAISRVITAGDRETDDRTPLAAASQGEVLELAIQRLEGSGASRHIRDAADGLRAMGYELRLAKTRKPGKHPENYLRIMDPAYTAHGIGYLTPTVFSFSRALDRERLAHLPGANLTGSSVNFSHVESAQPGLAAARIIKHGLPNRGEDEPTVAGDTAAAAATSQMPPRRSEALIARADEHVADSPPTTTLGRVGEDDLHSQRRLIALLREATGVTDVKPERSGIGGTVMLDRALGTKSTQRIALQQQADSLVLLTWPAELKPQAEALYRTGRAGRLMGFLATHPDAWQAQPKIHLAFHNAPIAQRLYLHCHLEITEYVRRWSGADFGKIGAHPFDRIREDLWPWLRERQYASPEDDQLLDAFLKRLGRRDAHLRPGIEVQRIWPWAHAVDPDERGALASEVRTAVAELLTALDEPLPPGAPGTQEGVPHGT